MTLSEAITITEDYQAFRRGLAPYDIMHGDTELRYGPVEYGQALDILIHISKQVLIESQ